MFTKDQNHRTLFREAECKRILLQFAFRLLKTHLPATSPAARSEQKRLFFLSARESIALDWI